MQIIDNPVPIIGRNSSGQTVYYTGKAGKYFVSPNPQDAFMGFSLEGARRKALQLNRTDSAGFAGGFRFVALVGGGELEAESDIERDRR